MRIICDAPGQTCNRLWTYVASVARCVAENRRMTILFFDWTIEDFPNLLHCPFIHFPLYHKRLLERGNNWERYKSLTWKATHSKGWDRVFRWLGCTKGWDTMDDTRFLAQSKESLKQIFRPREEIVDKATAFIQRIRQECDVVIGVHVRHGDYQTFLDGRFYYTLPQYRHLMLQAKALYPGRRVGFFVSSNAMFSTSEFPGCDCYRFGREPSGDILDLYTLSLCDAIMGPWSTYSRWASFIGEKPLFCVKDIDAPVALADFSVVTDFYHFQNGENTVDYWLRDV